MSLTLEFSFFLPPGTGNDSLDQSISRPPSLPLSNFEHVTPGGACWSRGTLSPSGVLCYRTRTLLRRFGRPILSIGLYHCEKLRLFLKLADLVTAMTAEVIDKIAQIPPRRSSRTSMWKKTYPSMYVCPSPSHGALFFLFKWLIVSSAGRPGHLSQNLVTPADFLASYAKRTFRDALSTDSARALLRESGSEVTGPSNSRIAQPKVISLTTRRCTIPVDLLIASLVCLHRLQAVASNAYVNAAMRSTILSLKWMDYGKFSSCIVSTVRTVRCGAKLFRVSS